MGGQQFVTGYISHIAQIPRLTNGPGYLKMNFTKRMLDELIPWFYEKKKTNMKEHEHIGGGYTNNHIQKFHKIDLDHFPAMRELIWKEMKGILEWWTGEKSLKHTATFGARIYRRGSMLINHVDRYDTHLASAVIQVHQEVDEDGGWPLEICKEEFNCVEVYLQPGELVLYEGARVRHGRPMRLKGDELGNVFSHFAPRDWHGPGASPNWNKRIASHKAEL